MSNLPLGIGEAAKKPEVVIVKETYPLPGTRKEIIALISASLERGNVQKLVVEVLKPLEVYRAVPKGEAQVPTEIPPDELFLAATHSEIVEFNFASQPQAHEHLFHAFAYASNRQLRVRALLVHSEAELRVWLEVDQTFNLGEVFGIETKAYPELPEGTALLVCVSPGEEDLAAISLRMSMN